MIYEAGTRGSLLFQNFILTCLSLSVPHNSSLPHGSLASTRLDFDLHLRNYVRALSGALLARLHVGERSILRNDFTTDFTDR